MRKITNLIRSLVRRNNRVALTLFPECSGTKPLAWLKQDLVIRDGLNIRNPKFVYWQDISESVKKFVLLRPVWLY